MTRVCAWCKKELGDSSSRKDAPVTHGICPDCVRKVLSYKGTSFRDFLAEFPQPILVVTKDVRIVAGNPAALLLLEKPEEAIEGQLGGDVFGCRYADLSGGCGETIHCLSCAIRLAVTNTWKTGKSNVRVPAYPELHRFTDEMKVRFLITTEKAGEAVLLRIDDVTDENAP